MWRNAPMRVLSSQGDLVDSYDPALKEHRSVCFLAFDGHCYMYRAVKRVLERQAAGARRGRPCRPSKSGGASTPRTCSGAVLVRGPAGGAAPAHGRRQEPQGGHQQPGAQPQQAHGRERSGEPALAPEGSKLLELDVIHMGCYETVTPQNSPQSMRVWPGLRLIGAGGKIPKGVFVAVAEVEPDGVRLACG